MWLPGANLINNSLPPLEWVFAPLYIISYQRTTSPACCTTSNFCFNSCLFLLFYIHLHFPIHKYQKNYILTDGRLIHSYQKLLPRFIDCKLELQRFICKSKTMPIAKNCVRNAKIEDNGSCHFEVVKFFKFRPGHTSNWIVHSFSVKPSCRLLPIKRHTQTWLDKEFR